MKKEYIIDKLNDIEESVKIGMEVDFFVFIDGWNEIKRIESFKIIEGMKKLFTFTYLLKYIDGNFNDENYKIRMCIKEDRCAVKPVNRKLKWVYTDVKEMTIKILNRIKKCNDKEDLLRETIFAEILDEKDIDNNTL
jgi:hypothetical protein